MKLKFGSLVAAVSVAAALVCGGTLPSRAQTVLTAQAPVPAGNTFYDGFKTFTERVEKLSGGRLKINMLPAGAVVPVFEQLDAVAKGVLDMGFSSPSYWVGRNKAAALFGNAPGGPYGMDVLDYMGWMNEGDGLKFYRQLYTDVLKRDVVAFPLMSLNPQMLGWFKNEINNWADLKGTKCRQVGIAGEVYAAAGMPVVNLPGGEIVPAGDRGVIDCAEWIGPGDDLRMGFYQVWKNYYMPSVHDPIAMTEMMINGEVYRKLPADLQEVLASAAQEVTFRYIWLFNKLNAEALQVLREKHGVQVRKTPDDVHTNVLASWDQLAKAEADKNEFFKKVLESQKAYAAVVVPARSKMYPDFELIAKHYWPDN